MSLTQVPLVCDKLGHLCRGYLANGNCRHWHRRPACGIKLKGGTSPCLACFRLCTVPGEIPCPLSTLTLCELDKEPPARGGKRKYQSIDRWDTLV